TPPRAGGFRLRAHHSADARAAANRANDVLARPGAGRALSRGIVGGAARPVCFVVGWWAGGRALMALGWVALTTWMMWQRPADGDAYANLARGWSLLLGGAFGLVCLFGPRRSLFSRSMLALSVTLFLAFAMSAMGPITVSEARKSIKKE